MNEKISESEAFEISYRVFLNAVNLMAEDAETQCKIMGNYNVAWELKDDVSAGAYLLDHAGGNLSRDKQFAVGQFLKELDKIPRTVLHEATSKEANLRAMKHPCWVALRKHATILARTLQTTL